MSTFESEVTKAACNDFEIFNVLSDMRNVEHIKAKIPQDKVSNLIYDCDSCHFSINPIGNMGVRIIDREPNKTIKFTSDQSMIGFDFWIQLKQVAENDTRIKLTIKADLNFIVKSMVEPMIQPILNKLANALANLPYKNYQNKI
ncbi:MAG: SRPBCC family protein [Paludibacteraceae bacterium]|nr:SRPBCC family protein [Paludibacteraceae bacterium]MBR2261726.1 SRPBCC family protein [Paludibacteraceae bacterium]MEE3483421.1 SRPBCC domain-containing protein [Bacteroidales bacterium]